MIRLSIAAASLALLAATVPGHAQSYGYGYGYSSYGYSSYSRPSYGYSSYGYSSYAPRYSYGYRY
jgi:hypothetical protein